MPAQPAMSLPMGAILKFELPGAPIAWGRAGERVIIPKDRNKRPFVHHYVDKQTEGCKKALAQMARIAMRSKPIIQGPVQVTIVAWMPIPTSWSGVKRLRAQNGEIRPTTKPDYDNFAKIVGDALNGVVWWDDSQIVDGQCVKMYSHNPRMTVEVVEL